MSFVVVRWSTRGPQLQHLGCKMFATVSASSLYPQLERRQAREDLWHFQSGGDKDKSLMLQGSLWSSWPEGWRLRVWQQETREEERERVQLLQIQERRERMSLCKHGEQVNDASVLEADNVRSFAATIRSALWRTTLAGKSQHTDLWLTLNF